MDIRIEGPHREQISVYLTNAVAWANEVFFDGEGNTEITRLVPGPDPRTWHTIESGAPACLVSLSFPSELDGLRHQAGHEAFHIAAGANVYHWTHEMLACLTTFYRHLEWVKEGHFGAKEYLVAMRGKAETAAATYSAHALRAEVIPAAAETNRDGFYGRATVVGLKLKDAVGLTQLGALAREVGDASCEGDPHRSHSGCAKDAAMLSWVHRLPVGARTQVEEALELSSS